MWGISLNWSPFLLVNSEIVGFLVVFHLFLEEMYRSLILTLTFIAIIGYRYLVGYEEPLDNLWHRWNYLFSSTVTSTIEKDASSPKLMEADMTVVIRI